MTAIEWTHFPGYAGATWNPVIGCRHVAEGCRNCYAEKMSKRLAAMGQADYAQILDAQGRFNGKAITRPEYLDAPLRKRKPTCYFVNSMSDLFHDDVPDDFIAECYAYMQRAYWHLFIVLTKRPKRMRALLSSEYFADLVDQMDGCAQEVAEEVMGRRGLFDPNARVHGDIRNLAFRLPAPNIIHGYSMAEQKDEHGVADLLATPSALRCLSIEPLVGPVDLYKVPRPDNAYFQWRGETGAISPKSEPDDFVYWCKKGIDWVIVGGESGPGARPCDVAWIRSIVGQCKAAGVPCFVKQLGARPFSQEPAPRELVPQASMLRAKVVREIKVRDGKGGDPAEWPEDLRIRQFPTLGQSAEAARG